MEFIGQIISHLSFGIGIIGVGLIFIGAIRSLWNYIEHKGNIHHLAHTRLILGTHLVFGLDFLVGKDIIDTIILPSNSFQWNEIGSLASIIAIRVVLTYFLAKELEDLKKQDGEEEK